VLRRDLFDEPMQVGFGLQVEYIRQEPVKVISISFIAIDVMKITFVCENFGDGLVGRQMPYVNCG
jgi:hypothetical protein